MDGGRRRLTGLTTISPIGSFGLLDLLAAAHQSLEAKGSG